MDQEAFFFDLEDENDNSIGQSLKQQTELKGYLELQRELAPGEYVELPCYPNRRNFDWSTIVGELSKDLHCMDDLIEAMQTYNDGLRNKNFDNLYLLCKEGLTADECIELFDQLLPKMIQLAFRLPELIRQPIPLLKQGRSFKLHFTQQQVSCLLANAFFCTFPSDPNDYKLPEINFNQLYTRSTQRNHVKVEKLKCFLNYFKRVTADPPTGIITFERRSVDESKFPNWSESRQTLCGLQVLKNTRIEDQFGIQADFANKKIGGGVLRTGCVQEEIRFLANPELVVARLFSESLWSNEVLILTGSEQFNQFSGYAETFKYVSDFQDVTELDEFKRRKCWIVAMDAVNYSRNTSQQYEESYLRRDCNKAYCGFVTEGQLNARTEVLPSDQLKMISGSWGCGAFKGEKHYKAIIQLIAASESGRDLVYVSFEDDGFKDQLDEFYEHLLSKNYTVGRVYQLLATYGAYKGEHPSKNFFDFVYHSSS